MEKNNPALKSQLFDVDVVYSFSSAVQVILFSTVLKCGYQFELSICYFRRMLLIVNGWNCLCTFGLPSLILLQSLQMMQLCGGIIMTLRRQFYIV